MYKKKNKLPKAQMGNWWDMDNQSEQQSAIGTGFITPGVGPHNVAALGNPYAHQEMQTTWGRDINWKHAFGSQLLQGIGTAMSNGSANSYQNATLRFNEQQYNPMNYLAHTANNSKQGLYGYQDGGEVDEGDTDMRNYIFDEGEYAPQQSSITPQQQPRVEPQGPTDEEIYAALDFRRTPKKKRDLSIPGEDGIDPNVLAAVAELKGKFPGLQVTSAIRNWGDKDGHPAGRAIDLAGPGLSEAYDYYSKNIVPKYGFEKALPLNHGTGPHIHAGHYQQGGQISAYNPNAASKDKAFQTWYTKNTMEGKNGMPFTQSLDYDYYSYFKNGEYKNYQGGHFPDTYKMPNHPTFSDESIYSVPGNKGGHWNGEQFIPQKQEGGLINKTGYLDGTPTANNPYNIIPGGDITMEGVSQPIVATTFKKGKKGETVIMQPGENYQFDADYVHETPLMQKGGVKRKSEAQYLKERGLVDAHEHGDYDNITPNQARDILHAKHINDKPLTPEQYRLFGFLSEGNTKHYADGGLIEFQKGGVKQIPQGLLPKQGNSSDYTNVPTAEQIAIQRAAYLQSLPKQPTISQGRDKTPYEKQKSAEAKKAYWDEAGYFTNEHGDPTEGKALTKLSQNQTFQRVGKVAGDLTEGAMLLDGAFMLGKGVKGLARDMMPHVPVGPAAREVYTGPGIQMRPGALDDIRPNSFHSDPPDSYNAVGIGSGYKRKTPNEMYQIDLNDYGGMSEADAIKAGMKDAGNSLLPLLDAGRINQHKVASEFLKLKNEEEQLEFLKKHGLMDNYKSTLAHGMSPEELSSQVNDKGKSLADLERTKIVALAKQHMADLRSGKASMSAYDARNADINEMRKATAANSLFGIDSHSGLSIDNMRQVAASSGAYNNMVNAGTLAENYAKNYKQKPLHHMFSNVVLNPNRLGGTHKKSYNMGEEYELTEKEIQDLIAQGYQIDI